MSTYCAGRASRNCDWITGNPEVILRSACKVGVFGNNQPELPINPLATLEPAQHLIFLVSSSTSHIKQRQETLKQSVHNLEISTRGQRLYEITSPISEWVRQQRMQTGLLTIFCRHKSASLLIQENVDPTVRTDIEAWFDLERDSQLRHQNQPPDGTRPLMRRYVTRLP